VSAPETVSTLAGTYEAAVLRSLQRVHFFTALGDEFDWFNQSRQSEPPKRDYLAEAMAELDDFLGWEG